MRNTSVVLRIGLAAAVLSVTLLPAGAAQEVGSSLTVLIPAGALGSARRVVVLTGAPKAAITVGNCKPGDYRPQDVEIIDRTGETPPTMAQVIVIDFGYRNDPVPFNGIELDLGTRLGSFRGGGECGPGYAGYTAHVLAP